MLYGLPAYKVKYSYPEYGLSPVPFVIFTEMSRGKSEVNNNEDVFIVDYTRKQKNGKLSRLGPKPYGFITKKAYPDC